MTVRCQGVNEPCKDRMISALTGDDLESIDIMKHCRRASPQDLTAPCSFPHDHAIRHSVFSQRCLGSRCCICT
jgi:hypothetical protein